MLTLPRIRTVLVALASAVLLGVGTSPVAVAQDDGPTPLTVAFVLPAASAGDPLEESVSRHFRQGLEMGVDEFVFNAGILGVELSFLETTVASSGEAVAAFEAFVAEEDIALLIGGLDTEGARALSEAAQRLETPFLNIGSSADALRNALCGPMSFHLEPSAGMYLDALAGWYVRAGFRQWFLVVGDDDESRSQVDRFLFSLRERHFGAREVGRASASDADGVVSAIQDAAPDVVLLLAPTQRQLELLAAMEEAGLQVETTGYPYQNAQTRAFYAASAAAAPSVGAGRRASAWEATLDAYGARELNARYEQRFGEPMESPAWAAFQAAKMAFEAAALGGATDPEAIAAFFRSDGAVFDLWKGIGVTFRPWNNQLRQPLYLVKIVPEATTARDRALLVGELPAIYMPQTDPIERLDQLGDLRNSTECAL